MTTTAFMRSVLVVFVATALFAAFEHFAPTEPTSLVGRAWRKAKKIALKRDRSAEDLEAQAEGYYEGLLDQGSRARASSLITGALTRDWTHWESQQIHVHQRKLSSFLYYEFKENVAVDRGLDPVHTNSHGLADREYSVEKPPKTRRIALLGDSLARGHGVRLDESFEQRLEDAMNADPALHPEGGKIEILNFAVDGYRITQIFDVAMKKVPAWSPDIYLVALSDLSIFRKWGAHLAQLVHDGIDVEYDFLRDVVKEADLHSGDDPATLDSKLAPFAERTLEEILRRIRDAARAQGAATVILFVPPVTDPERLRARFAMLKPMIEKLDLPIIDLTPTFVDVDDLDAYRISPQNHHPNAKGHQLLFERLLREATSRTNLLRLR